MCVNVRTRPLSVDHGEAANRECVVRPGYDVHDGANVLAVQNGFINVR